jgi:succinate dehydrogenase/fumarate reductase-like Fe-S protein/nitrate reductase gamma subunit
MTDPGGSLLRSSAPSPARTIKTLVLDIVFLRRTAIRSPYRFLMHTLILLGFLGLLLFHALDDLVSIHLFSGYEPTLDPWQLLRNLFGVMVLAGIAMAVVRRVRIPALKALSRKDDWLLPAVISAIILSGFLVEAAFMASPTLFDDMVFDYLYTDDPRDIRALQGYWHRTQGGPAPEGSEIISSDELKFGRELALEACFGCHSETSSAFASRTMVDAAPAFWTGLGKLGGDTALWYVHVALSLLALALLPYGKFLHVLTTPATLLARKGRTDSRATGPGPSSLGRGLAISSCTGCKECSLHCSVAAAFSVLETREILPSEKLFALSGYCSQEGLTGTALSDFALGSRVCTECLRCTEICPAGIDLQELWRTSKRSLAESGQGGPHREMLTKGGRERIRSLPKVPLPDTCPGLSRRRESFHGCIQCSTCTSVCPVVAVSEDPTRDLDLTPHQIMNLLRMGLTDAPLTARMVWSCTTCYKCQEYCPQGVPVADILYELRNDVAGRSRA